MKTIGARRDGPELLVELRLRGALAAALINEAFVRQMRPVDLLADIVETVLSEGLIKAVVDD